MTTILIPPGETTMSEPEPKTTYQQRLAEIEQQKQKLEAQAQALKIEEAHRIAQERAQNIVEISRDGKAELEASLEAIELEQARLEQAISVVRKHAIKLDELRTEHPKIWKRTNSGLYTNGVTGDEIRSMIGKLEKIPCRVVALQVEQDRRDSRPFVDWISDLRHINEVRREDRADEMVIVLKRGDKPYRLVNGENK